MKPINYIYLCLIGMASLAAEGCSEADADEPMVFQKVSQTAVVFDTYSTSSQIVCSDVAVPLINPDNEGFGVFAYSSDRYNWDAVSGAQSRASAVTTLVENRQVSYSSHSWSYFPQIYWPQDSKEKVSYFAWAPYSKKDKVQISSVGSSPTIIYDFISDKGDKVDQTKMFDLLTASTKDVTAADSQEAVTFKFDHALARVNLNVRANTDIYVEGSEKYTTRIVINDVQLSGSKFYGSGSYDIAENSWNNLSSVQSAVSISPMLNTESGLQYEGIAIEDTKPKTLLKDGEYLFLIPTGKFSADDDIEVTFDYDVITYDPNLPTGSFKYTNTETVKLNQVLKQGESYNLTFTISLDDIDFNANATKWSDPVNAEELDI